MNSALENSLNLSPGKFFSERGWRNLRSEPGKVRTNWNDLETRAFLETWKNHLYINRLMKKGCSKHPLYYAISKDLEKKGYNRSLKEICFKTKNILKQYRKAKLNLPVTGGITDFRYFKEIAEIFRLEKEIGTKDSPGPAQIIQTIEQPQIILDGTYFEEISSENIQVIRLSTPDQDVLDSNTPHYTVIANAEPEVQKETEVNQIPLPLSSSRNSVPLSSSNNCQEPPENILLGFFKEFERSNQELEKTDAAMLELFKEQNDIFRTQTTLLMKLLLK